MVYTRPITGTFLNAFIRQGFFGDFSLKLKLNAGLVQADSWRRLGSHHVEVSVEIPRFLSIADATIPESN
jgi:hypothetical protein